ncbi:MAG: ABC transporter permease [Dehalococcoidales bacterium]|jgi:NitT/TauT family transport system permease protein|nr:ABC transporter permease [Dehalococcoidales bacterium]NLT27517.1 ABC transporter permease [Dehalococcoidales bacterium]
MKILKKLKPGWGLLPILIFLILWELVARINNTPLLPPFSEVIVEFYNLIASGVLGENFLSSLTRVLIGFGAGSIVGIITGTIMGWNKIVDRALNPIFNLFFPIPTLGWIPLLMLWIGINEMLPITLIFICAFFPVMFNTVTGIKNVDRNYIKAARSLGASDMKILFTVVMPLALPNIFTGLKLESGMAWRTIIAAEMVAIPTGIGALLMKAESLIRIDIIIVCLIVLAIMCLSFEKFFEWLENRITSNWRQHAGNNT